MNESSPMITVLMPVFNGEKFLQKAIQSILDQTFTDFEFIIINDGSDDSTLEIINLFHDPRIRVCSNEFSLGLVKSLNIGIKLARGRYIARMDCDDISLPTRLITQFRFLSIHPEISVCGSWIKTIGAGVGEIRKYPLTSEDIQCELLFRSPLAHPSVMFNREKLQDNLIYDERYEKAEDYELWVRLSQSFNLANINQVLLLYRCHNHQVSKTSTETQKALSNILRQAQIQKIGLQFTSDEINIHQRLSNGEIIGQSEFCFQGKIWLEKLYEFNQNNNIFSSHSFSKLLSTQLYILCSTFPIGFYSWRIFWCSPLANYSTLNVLTVIKFFIKCLISRVLQCNRFFSEKSNHY